MAAVPVSGAGASGDGDLTGKARFQRADDGAAKMAAVPVSGAAKMAAVPVSGAAKMADVSVSSAAKPAARPQLTPEEQRKMMDDPKLNALLAALPGAKVTAIK